MSRKNRNMTPKLYRYAYKFLKARVTTGGLASLQSLNNLNDEERKIVIGFLTYQHQVKFI